VTAGYVITFRRVYHYRHALL